MLRSELVALDDLVAHPRNPKAHALDQLVASIERFGFIEPMVRDERTGFLLAGHGRTEALRRLRAEGKPAPRGVDVISTAAGLAWAVPVVHGFATKDDAEALAFLVAANQLTTLGGWDGVALARLLTGASIAALVAWVVCPHCSTRFAR